MTPPTSRQLDVLKAIWKHLQRCGYPPSIRGLCDVFGLSSTNGMAEHLAALESKGLLVRDSRVSRGMRLTPRGAKAAGGAR